MTVQDQETFGFQAEVVQLLDLMINSLYSNKEIFLRELISNASDAIDRLRLELLSKGENPEDEGPLRIRVWIDMDTATITIADNGIGMSRAEVIEHIGTIAKSGTREFFQALTGDQRKDATLDRAVRGGLLLRVHRGGPGGADHAAGRTGGGRGGPLDL